MAAAPGLAFADPVLDSQRVFRDVLTAMSRPGTSVPLAIALAPPAPLSPASAAIALTLLDLDTTVWLDPAASTDEALDYLKFHCGCPIVADRSMAGFAILADAAGLAELPLFSPGDPEYPDRSTTIIVQVGAIGRGRRLKLRGPGIEGMTEIAVDGLPEGFVGTWNDNHTLFPLGVDLILAAPQAILGLPRSIRVES